MHRSSLTAFVSVVAAGVLGGCGGSTGSLPAAGGNASVGLPATLQQAGTAKGLIYSSSYGANTVDYYLKGTGPNNPIAGALKGDFAAPQGIAVNKPGNVYVTNSNGQSVFVYAKGSKSPTLTLVDNNYFPVNVTVAPDGTVYVANGGGDIGASGDVLVYRSGASNPMETLTNGHFLHVEGVALDKNGNVFVSCNAGMGAGTGGVVEFPKGSLTGKDLHITLGAAGGVGFDGDGRLLVMDESVPSLNVYAPGKRKPLHQLSLPGASRYFAFSKTSRVLYVADYDLGEIEVYDYAPNALTKTNTITNGILPSNDNLGIAVYPSQQ